MITKKIAINQKDTNPKTVRIEKTYLFGIIISTLRLEINDDRSSLCITDEKGTKL